jgi:CheY-like chemotaxis protein
MGGRLELESALGVGSVFRLTLPLSSAPRNASTPVPMQAPRALVRRRVLLAEDNPINARLATRLLEKLGQDVRHCGNGREAVEAFGRGDVDVILMDVQMPELDGLEATRQIRARELGASHVPIIALTANAMKGDDQLCFDAGMDAYLTKPLDRVKLEEVLARWVAG